MFVVVYCSYPLQATRQTIVIVASRASLRRRPVHVDAHSWRPGREGVVGRRRSPVLPRTCGSAREPPIGQGWVLAASAAQSPVRRSEKRSAKVCHGRRGRGRLPEGAATVRRLDAPPAPTFASPCPALHGLVVPRLVGTGRGGARAHRRSAHLRQRLGVGEDVLHRHAHPEFQPQRRILRTTAPSDGVDSNVQGRRAGAER